MRHPLIALVLLAATSTVPAHGARIELVRDGRSCATIVVADDRDDGPKRSALDLQHYVEAITGVRLPMRTDGRRVDGVGLYVGRCQPSRDADLPPADVTPEAFAVRVRDGNVFFVGRATPAVEFAVVSFIEDRLGVRWFWPGPLGEVLPPRSPGKLAVNVEDEVVVPDWSPRVWSGNSYYPSWRDWNRRNKLSIGPPLPRRQFQNYVWKVFPTEKYAETHPEYYPLVKGKRWIPPKGVRHWRPCESNPEVQQLIVDHAVEYFKQHPESDSFSLGMDDIATMCSCPACIAMDARPHRDYALRRFSDRHYKFVNTMARKIAERCPGKHVGTLIYNIARTLPKTVDRLEPNVFGYLTQVAPEWWRRSMKRHDMDLTREWAKRCSQLYRYDYWGLGFLTPRYCPHNVDEAMKFDKSVGLRGIYIEVYTCWPNTGPMIWAGSKLFWETGLDVDGLLDEFFTKMFGQAAPVMKRYYDRLEQSWNTPRAGRIGWGHSRVDVNARSMSLEDLVACERMLVEARQAAKRDVVRKRIDVVAAGLAFGSYLIRLVALGDEIDKIQVKDRTSAEAALTKIVEINRLASDRVKAWRTIRARRDLAGETFNALAKYSRGRKFAQANGLAAGAATVLPQVLQWFAQHAPERSDAVAGQLKALQGPLGELARAWLFVQRSKPKNLLVNGDFETAGKNRAKSELDWSTTDAPPGWSTWTTESNQAARFRVAAGKGAAGSSGAGIAGAASACYLQTVAVKPGQRYLCRVQAARAPADDQGQVSLSVRWRRPDGRWLEPRTHEGLAALATEAAPFDPLMLLTTVPPGAGRLVLLLSARDEDKDAVAWFDNAAVYPITE